MTFYQPVPLKKKLFIKYSQERGVGLKILAFIVYHSGQSCGSLLLRIHMPLICGIANKSKTFKILVIFYSKYGKVALIRRYKLLIINITLLNLLLHY